MPTLNTSATGFYINDSNTISLVEWKGTQIEQLIIGPLSDMGGISSFTDLTSSSETWIKFRLLPDNSFYSTTPDGDLEYLRTEYLNKATHPVPLGNDSFMTWRFVDGTNTREASTAGYKYQNDQTYYKGDKNTLFDITNPKPCLSDWTTAQRLLFYIPLDAITFKRGYADAYELKTDVENGAIVGFHWQMGIFDIDYTHPDHGTATPSTGGPVTYHTSPSPPPPATSSTQSPAPSVSPVPAISAPSPKTFNLTGGSILLLHSDTNPPTSPTPPTPNDFFTRGMPASGLSTTNHTFTSDMLSNVVLTNNSINTIFYYVMDAAQNIQYLGHVTFYVDRDKPVGSLTPPSGASWVDTAFPTANTPYTAEWLGKNKMAPFDGNISLCDLPGTSPTSTWPYTISAGSPSPGSPSPGSPSPGSPSPGFYTGDKGADPSLDGYSGGGVIRHIAGINHLQMNDAGDEVVGIGVSSNQGPLMYQFNGTDWVIATGEETRGLYDSVHGGVDMNVAFSKGPSDYLVSTNFQKCVVRKKVSGVWDPNVVWAGPKLHPADSFGGNASCPVDTSIGADRFVCMNLNDASNVYFTVYKKGSGDNWSIEDSLGPIPFPAGFYGLKMTDDGSRVITVGNNENMLGHDGIMYVWTRSGTTWTRQADVSPPARISSGLGSSVLADGTRDYGAWVLNEPLQFGRLGFDISSDGEWLITSSGNQGYNSLYYDGGEIYFYQWTGSTYAFRQRIKVSSFCDYGDMIANAPDGSSLFSMNGDGTRAVIPLRYQTEYRKGKEKLWVLERTGSTWAPAKYLTIQDDITPWVESGTLVSSAGPTWPGFDLNNYHASRFHNMTPPRYLDAEGYSLTLGERPSAMSKSGNVIVTCTNLLNYKHSQQPGAVVWDLSP